MSQDIGWEATQKDRKLNVGPTAHGRCIQLTYWTRMSVDEKFLLDASCNGWKPTFVSLDSIQDH